MALSTSTAPSRGAGQPNLDVVDQELHRASDLAGLPEPPAWNAFDQLDQHLFGDRGHHFGLDVARCYAVDRDALAGDLLGPVCPITELMLTIRPNLRSSMWSRMALVM
jgi:hypothetical protein